jgi:hypothetical protein
MTIKYELIQLNSTNSLFYEALKIYSNSIDYTQKTDTREITYWINNLDSFKEGELLFFALMSNNIAIGFAEISFIKENRILIIDYITIAETYRSNSAFYSFFSLIINYVNDANLDYDFITKEILCRHDETQKNLSDIRLYELEEFKVANCLYMHPQLEKNNIESEKEALIMIHQKSNLNNSLKKETYIKIVDYIYNYYYVWDKPFLKTPEDNSDYLNKHKEYLDKIKESLDTETMVTLNGYPFKLSLSTDGSNIPNIRKNKIVSNALMQTSIVILMVLFILFFAKKLDIKVNTIVVVIVAELLEVFINIQRILLTW